MTKIEEMARAAYVEMTDGADRFQRGAPFVPWEQLGAEQRGILLKMMRAALKMLREPSEAMVDACYDPDVFAELPGPGSYWKAMIDAALKE